MSKMVYQNEEAVLRHLGVYRTWEVFKTTKETFTGTPKQAEAHCNKLAAQKNVIGVQAFVR